MDPAIEAKRQALLTYKKSPNQISLKALRTARRCANSYWLSLWKNIQDAADTGDVRRMYEGMKKQQVPLLQRSPL